MFNKGTSKRILLSTINNLTKDIDRKNNQIDERTVLIEKQAKEILELHLRLNNLRKKHKKIINDLVLRDIQITYLFNNLTKSKRDKIKKEIMAEYVKNTIEENKE